MIGNKARIFARADTVPENDMRDLVQDLTSAAVIIGFITATLTVGAAIVG